MRRTTIALLAAMGLMAIGAGRPAFGQPAPPTPAGQAPPLNAPPATQPEHPLAAKVRQMLAAGQVTEAIAETDRQLKASPNDPGVVTVYAELRMGIARQAMAAQKFALEEQLLNQVIAAKPDHATAGKMLAMIAEARAGIDGALTDAEQLLRLERFEQAAALFAQIAGLIPDQPQRWKPSWLSAATGAGDDQYMMSNYEAALPFYSQAIELGAAEGSGAEAFAWRWSHCYAMNLARTAAIPRPAAAWQAIIDEAKGNFATARADLLGHFIVALGRHNLGEYAESLDAYRQVLGAGFPELPGNLTARQQADAVRPRAIAYVDSLNRSNLIDRRGGAWAMALPGEPVVRKSDSFNITVKAPNDLVARRVLEAADYHAPRLVRYLGGVEEDLKWTVEYVIDVRAKSDAMPDAFIPSFTLVQSRGGRLVKHVTEAVASDPLLIGATIPHELTHALVNQLAGYPPMLMALDEGLAIHAETTARYLMFRRAVLETGGASSSVAQLLAADKMPQIGQRARFYGECYNLVAWLLTRGKPKDVIKVRQLTGGANPLSPKDALLKVFQFPDMPTAERAYRAFLEDQGLVWPAAGR